VQTQISVNAMTAKGEQFGKVAGSIKHGITVQVCVDKIISAIEKDKSEVVIGKGISYWAPLINRLFPNLFRKLTAANNFRE
jgi:hypothetical protein